MWFGKIIAGLFGFMFMGPVGAVLGIMIGHMFDRGLSQTFSMTSVVHGPNGLGRDVNEAFFNCVFIVMGRLAKADGRISEDEIALAEQLMAQMQLSPDQRAKAIGLFKKGADPNFDFAQPLRDFMAVAPPTSGIKETVLTLLIGLALVDSDYHRNEKAILMQVSEILGFSSAAFEQLFNMVYAQSQFDGKHEAGKTPEQHLDEAYEALGVSKQQSMPEIKRAYRKLMSEHHPDKLIAQGVPEEMIKLSTEKSQQIQAAYELIKKSKS